jgi:hypothetical protein
VNPPPASTSSARTSPANSKVYIHELIDIIGHNRARYMHHMTANWCPVAREERDQLCFGVWATVGSTGNWPEVVNLWELDGWDGLVANFAHETVGSGAQDPSLVEWWSVAASLRRGGVDRIVVPEPWTRPIDQLLAEGVKGEVYAHELITVMPGQAPALLQALHDVGLEAVESLGVELIGAFRVAMVNDAEVILIWAIPTWARWAELEQAWLDVPASSFAVDEDDEWEEDLVDRPGAALDEWRAILVEMGADVRRTVLVDAPLAPLRTGRQPQVEDRLPLDEI